MVPRMSHRLPGRLRVALLALLTGAILSLAGLPARADDKKETVADTPGGGDVKKDSALSRVPADSSLFVTYLRNKEQLDRLHNSRAFKALHKQPLFQMAYKQALAKLNEEGGPLEAYKKFTENKENKELVNLVLGALSDEVFLWGSKGWSDLLVLYGKVNGAQTFAPLGALFGAQGGAEKAQMRGMLLALQKNSKLIQVPGLVLGFKVKEPKKIVAQLKRLQKPLAKQLEDNDKLKGKLKLKGDFLTLQLDSSIVPWDDIPFNAFENKKGEFDDLLKLLKKLTVTVSLGVKDGYLLLGLTSTLEDLENLGKGKSLAERDELKVIDRFASKKITALGYTSSEFMNAASGDRDFGEMASSLKKLIEKSPLKAEHKKALDKDADDLFAGIKKISRRAGAQMGVAFLSETGYEGYAYDFGDHDRLKGINTKLVNHVGGNPIFAAGVGFDLTGSNYAWFRKWAQQVYGHGETIFMEQADDNAKDIYKKNVKVFMPLLKQFDDATTRLLLPSMKKSGLGIVIDAKWSSKQWHAGMPKSDKALPMVELGLLIGINDGKKFAGAIKEYRTTLNEFYEKVRSIEGLPNTANLPEFKVPAPDSTKGKNGTLYTWKLPEESGLDKQVVITTGTSKDVAVLTGSTASAERLLGNTKLASSAGPLPVKGDLVGFMVLDWPALIDAALPWVDFSLNTFVGSPTDEQEQKKAKAMMAEYSRQAKEIARILKCFQGVTSATYLEEGRLVTHSRSVYKDLQEKQAPPPKPND